MNRDYQTPCLSQEEQAKALFSGAKQTRRSRVKRSLSLFRFNSKAVTHNYLYQIFQKLDKNTLLLIDLLLKADNNKKFSCIAYTQTTMARMLGISRDTISEKLRLLIGLGFIKSHYRHMKSCIYVLSSIFYIKNHRGILKKFLPFIALLFAPIHSDTTSSSYSSYSYSSRIYKDSLVRDYAQTRTRAKILGITFRNVIMSVLSPSPVRPIGANQLDYLGIVARRKNMEKKLKEIHTAINSITEIDLSLYGKCKLTIFTPEAIQSARWKMRDAIAKKRTIDDPFQVFFSLCEAVSLKRGERRDYETFRLLNQKHNFLSTDNPLISKKVSIKPLRKKKQVTEYKSPPAEPPKTVQELEREYAKVMNNDLMQITWRAMPSIKQAWLASFNAQMSAAKELNAAEVNASKEANNE